MNFWEAREAALSGKDVQVYKSWQVSKNWEEYPRGYFDPNFNTTWSNNELHAKWRLAPEVHEFEATTWLNDDMMGECIQIDCPDTVPENKKWKVRLEEIIE